jgi:hypothetical protein
MAMIFENLKQKTFISNSPNDIDKFCNDFGNENIVRFTQTNQLLGADGFIRFTATLFYLPGKGTEAVASAQSEVSTNSSAYNTAQEKLPESEAQWATCTVCQKRWKWSHYKRCPNNHQYLEGLPMVYYDAFKKIHGETG